MLQLYSNSVALAVMTLYPEITWSPWKFLSQGKSKWLSLITKIKDIQATSNRFDPVAATSLLMYFQELEKSLAINNVQEWNDFLDPNPAKVLPTKVQTDLDKIGGLVVALSLAYPWVEWPPGAIHHTNLLWLLVLIFTLHYRCQGEQLCHVCKVSIR